MSISEMFHKDFAVLGVISVPDLFSVDLIENIAKDFNSLQEGGIDGILFENEGYKGVNGNALPETVKIMKTVLQRVRPKIEVPFLVNVLRTDYKASFNLAKEFKALGIWQDLLVDKAIPINFERRIVLEPEPEGLKNYQRKIQAEEMKIFCEVQPWNFYERVEKKPIELSIAEAKNYADAITLIGIGKPPSLKLIKKAKEIVGKDYPIGIAGKVNATNVVDYVGQADYSCVFSYLRYDSNYSKPISKERVQKLMKVIERYR